MADEIQNFNHGKPVQPLPPFNQRRALITGVTGQDGSYLVEFLLAKVRCLSTRAPRTSPLSAGVHALARVSAQRRGAREPDGLQLAPVFMGSAFAASFRAPLRPLVDLTSRNPTLLTVSQGYEVHGIVRRSSSFNTGRLEHIYHDRHEAGVSILSDALEICCPRRAPPASPRLVQAPHLRLTMT